MVKKFLQKMKGTPAAKKVKAKVIKIKKRTREKSWEKTARLSQKVHYVGLRDKGQYAEATKFKKAVRTLSMPKKDKTTGEFVDAGRSRNPGGNIKLPKLL